ncbi:MAG: hypothetical protein A3D10_02810 [Omnitrophica WOR_2 bacterium RIFCSPHIGHO2_02_FULL_48_11]|nr:MAG: hypothetical protein A3D10_02810 [Omnitrophica WOR_2 bacterium RIFCSPHIGHO2_02_FULL_48_11]
MDFEKVFKFLLENFEKQGVCYALMGGFALHAAGYTRATQDIDILILKEDMPKVKKLLLSLGYELLHESADVSNFKGALTELGQIDFLHAHRHYTKNMLKRAQECGILNNKLTVKVLIPEDIIGLKVQAMANDPARHTQDSADIEKLLKLHKDRLDLKLLKEYFALFGREKELAELLKRT